jgi:hypothetical protein
MQIEDSTLSEVVLFAHPDTELKVASRRVGTGLAFRRPDRCGWERGHTFAERKATIGELVASCPIVRGTGWGIDSRRDSAVGLKLRVIDFEGGVWVRGFGNYRGRRESQGDEREDEG